MRGPKVRMLADDLLRKGNGRELSAGIKDRASKKTGLTRSEQFITRNLLVHGPDTACFRSCHQRQAFLSPVPLDANGLAEGVAYADL